MDFSTYNTQILCLTGAIISEAHYNDIYYYVQITHTARSSTICYLLCTKPTEIWRTNTGFIRGILKGVRYAKSLLFLHRRSPSWTTLVLYSRVVFIFNEPTIKVHTKKNWENVGGKVSVYFLQIANILLDRERIERFIEVQAFLWSYHGRMNHPWVHRSYDSVPRPPPLL